MATTRLFAPRPYDSIDFGIAGVAPILSTGTDVDNTKLASVQAASVADGYGTLPTSAGGTAPAPVAEPLRFRGAWQINTVYSYGDVVTQGGSLYVAPISFTSGSSFVAGNWTKLGVYDATDPSFAATYVASADGVAFTWNGSSVTLGGAEIVVSVASSGSTETLTVPASGILTEDLTLDAATVTLTFAGGIAGKACVITLLARQDATGGRLIAWPGSVTWASGSAPTLSTSGGAVDVISFLSVNGGTSWIGFAGAGGGSTSRYRSTSWVVPKHGRGTSAVTPGSAGAFTASPLDLGAVTVTQLAVNVTSAAASAVARVGIYSDNNGVPGTLLVDPTSSAGLDCSTTGVKTTTTFSQPVTGRVWVACLVQGATITLTADNGNFYTDGVAYDTASNAFSFWPGGYSSSTNPTSGGLPSTFPAISGGTLAATTVAGKVG